MEDNHFVTDESVQIINGQYGKYSYQKDRKPVFVPMGAAVYVKRVLVDASNSERTLVLTFKDAQGTECSANLERKKLTEIGITELLGQGVQVSKKTAGVLITSLMNQEPNVTHEIQHTKLGFHYFKGKKVFLGAKGIGVESTYTGTLKIVPTGDFEVWKDMVRTEVIGTNLETILAIACSAPLVDFLKEKAHISNLLVSLVSESSTGKTTAGCLGVSVGSQCSFAEDSMVATFADSSNSLMRSIYSSYPLLIDEGSLIRQNPTSLIYELAEGKEKGRLSKTLEKEKQRTFATAIFMTSEKSILNLCDENTGLLVRCLEFKNVVWTKTAKSADHIKTICESNYGFLIPMIAKELLGSNIAEIMSQYYAYQKKVVERAKQNGRYTSLIERLAKSIAVILLSADYFYEVTGIALDKEKMLDFIESNTAVSDIHSLAMGNRVIDYLRQYVSIYFPQFVLKKRGSDKPIIPSVKEIKGKIETISPKLLKNKEMAIQELFLPSIVFDEILKEGNFPDKNVVLKDLKEKGYLHSEKDRFVSKIVIAHPPEVSGYRIYITEKIREEKTNEN